MKLKTTALLGAAALALMAGSAWAGDLACLITKNNTNPFFVKMKEGAEKAAAEAGLDFQAYAGEKDGDAAPQITAIENCVAAGAKGILITPSNDSVGPALKDARAAGILVIALDTPLADAEAQDITFATDNCLAGDYPLARFLYVYVNKKPGAAMDTLTAEFLKFIASKEGQEIVVKDGYFPIPAKVAAEDQAILSGKK